MTDIGDILGLNKNGPNGARVIQSKAIPPKKNKQNNKKKYEHHRSIIRR